MNCNRQWLKRMTEAPCKVTAGNKIRIARLDKFVPGCLKVMKLGADSTKQQVLVRTGQVCEKQGGTQLGGGPSKLRQRSQENITGRHAVSSGLRSALVYSGSWAP